MNGYDFRLFTGWVFMPHCILVPNLSNDPQLVIPACFNNGGQQFHQSHQHIPRITEHTQIKKAHVHASMYNPCMSWPVTG